MSDIPSGYTKLAVIGIAYKGDYDSTVTYKKLNAVYYDGSTYVALIDSPSGTPSNDGTNWKYLAKGFLSQSLDAFTALDAQGLLGTVGANVDAQDLVDKIAEILNAKEDSFTKNTAFNKNFETSASAMSMDGTASAGTSSNVARADHVHPSDTTKLNTNGDAKDVTVTFTSADTTTDPSYTAIDVITSGETESSLMNKVSQMAQNQRAIKSEIDNAYTPSTGQLNIQRTATGYDNASIVARQLNSETGNNIAELSANSEGGNLRLTKGTGEHLELDTCTMNGTDGNARLYLGNSANELTKTFLFNEDGSFKDGNGKSLDDITHENLLDNPWFTVNQRGVTSYTSGDNEWKYTVDRWLITPNTSLSVADNGITFTNNNSDWNNLYSLISCENLFDKNLILTIMLADKTTQSLLFTMPSSFPTSSTVIAQNSFTYNSIGFSLIAYLETTRLQIAIGLENGKTLPIRAVKLEIGSISTLENDVAPNYELELYKCATSTVDSGDTYANMPDITTVSKLGDITQAFSSDIGTSGTATICANMLMQIVGKGKCNIKIKYKILARVTDSPTYQYSPFDLTKIRSALGLNTLTYDIKQTSAKIDSVTETTCLADTTEPLGYTGLLFDNGGALARIYEESGSYGGWGISNNVYTVGSYGEINIIGASYT